MTTVVDRLWTDARLVTLSPDRGGLGIVERGAVATSGERIVFAGPQSELPVASRQARETTRCDGRWITPGLVDCHTHLVYAGDRAREFELRLNGASYEEIARAGGGIASSLQTLRAADAAGLIAQSLVRLDDLLAEGVTTVEIKSGYGLDFESERKSLWAATRLSELRDVTVRRTFLGAHALPPEARGDKNAHIEAVVAMLPRLASEGLVDAVDAFCEDIAFSPAQVEKVFAAARALGLRVKLHADQLSDLGGAALAARFGALSADHLEYASEAGVDAMAVAGTVAVMLPCAYYFIRETKIPPIAAFRAAGVPMAVATDCNPGTSPLTSLLLAMNMAATLFRMTVEECLRGVTVNAARALGLGDAIGSLEPGKFADFAIHRVA